MGTKLRLISANLWNGRAVAELFASFVAEQQPDIVAVQEVGPRQAEAIARVMPYGRLEPARDYTGTGIALRRPGTVRRFSLGYRDACVAEIELGDGVSAPLEVISVHIEAPSKLPQVRSFYRRRRQLRHLIRYLETNSPPARILVGDLNSTPRWPFYRHLAARLTDAAAEAAQQRGVRPAPTWGPGAWAPRMFRIDHAFVRGVAVEDFRVCSIPGSDHSAIVVDFSIPSR